MIGFRTSSRLRKSAGPTRRRSNNISDQNDLDKTFFDIKKHNVKRDARDGIGQCPAASLAARYESLDPRNTETHMTVSKPIYSCQFILDYSKRHIINIFLSPDF